MNSNYSVFDSTPTTFLVPSSLEGAEYQDFVTRYEELQRGFCLRERVPHKHTKQNMWLIKPAAANQGRGIEMFRNLPDMLSFIGSKVPYSYWVVQKYIERPLLFKGRKFDIRVWVLFTHKQEVFFYRNGYLRTSSDYFSLDNKNNYVHLTNNCLQKFGDKYG